MMALRPSFRFLGYISDNNQDFSWFQLFEMCLENLLFTTLI